MNRVDIINHLIKKFNYKNYLEIGVRLKSDCFDLIQINNKTSIDPGYETNNEVYDYRMESDVFFKNLNEGRTEFKSDHTWDIILIDGLHLAEQVERDIINSLQHLSPKGMIVLHDCNPYDEMIARESLRPNWPHPPEWSGTVWKAFYKFRHTRSDLNMFCIDTDWGVGIIRKGTQVLAPNDNPYYSYNKFASNRAVYLNLISPEQFIQRF